MAAAHLYVVAAAPAPVPTVDLSTDEEAVVAAIRDAFGRQGFFKVKRHGVNADLVERMFQENERFFALPTEEKLKTPSDANHRGYTPQNEEMLDPANQSTGDTKEAFHIGREVSANSADASKPFQGPNQWPSEALLPEFRPTAMDYIQAMRALAVRLIRLIALSLGLPRTFFDDKFDPPILTLRLLRYSPERSNLGEGVLGSGAHTDFGMLTILATDSNPGLQLLYNNQWYNVVPESGTFIINLGDMLERWTNGIYKSAPHRVLNLNGKPRYSIGFFYDPCPETVVECLPQCCVNKAAAYSKTTCAQHLIDKVYQAHAAFQRHEDQKSRSTIPVSS